MTAIPFRQEICYPESDGQPMAESDLHRKEMEEDGSMASKTLGLILRSEDSGLPEGSQLRLIDPSTGEVLRTHLESEAGRSHAETRARSAETRARAAEDENARLRAEIERLRRGQD